MRVHALICLLGALVWVVGCPAGDDDTLGDDDTDIPEPGFTIDGPLDTISPLTFTPELTALGVDESTLQISWDFGDGATVEPGALQSVEHQYLATGPYTVTMVYESTEADGPTGSLTEPVTIDFPDYWPTILPCYYIGGFSPDPVDEMAADPYNVRAVLLSAFDLYNTADGTVNHDLIDDLHGAGLLVWVDVAQWNPPWSVWDDMAAVLVLLVQAGIDGIDFDEFGSGGPSLSADAFNALRDDLLAINPHVRLAITQIYFSDIEELLEDGANADYVALEWYLSGSFYFDDARDLAADHGTRLAYWVDPSTYDKIEQTYEDADSVFLWNLCWSQSTCGDEYPANTWVPWESVAAHVMDLGPGI